MIPEFYHLNTALSPFDRTHNLQITNLTELPFGPGKRWLNERRGARRDRRRVAGEQHPELHERDPVRRHGVRHVAERARERAARRPGERRCARSSEASAAATRGSIPFAFKPVTEARFGTAPWGAVRGPGYANWDVGVFRQFGLPRSMHLQLRFEAFNVLDTPHFNNPGGNVSNLQLNPDGTVRNLNGFAEVTSAFGERQMRVGVRMGW